MMISVFDRLENIVGEGEIASYCHFLPFLQCFQKVLYSGAFKFETVWERLKCHILIVITCNIVFNFTHIFFFFFGSFSFTFLGKANVGVVRPIFESKASQRLSNCGPTDLSGT